MTFPRFTTPFLLAAALIAGNAHAQSAAPAAVEGAWARASVQGQSASGAFMRITAQEPLQLLRAETPAAGHAEVHEMKMDGGVMKMRALSALDLPAGQAVELKPGGYHIMLMDLKAPLAKGAQLPLTLVFKDAQGAERRLDLQLPVSATPPGGAGGHGAPMHKQH
ncbi:MAG: copper chaperone PCu(A)C [Simplicispira sp.]|nr:copper chaperone PCu(A)C [Simplicispira sp.]